MENTNVSEDSMNPTQQSQWMREHYPPGQNKYDQACNSSQIHVDIDKKIDQYNADLIVANNNSDSDTGVNALLIALKNRDDKLKIAELNKIRKPGLEAGLRLHRRY